MLDTSRPVPIWVIWPYLSTLERLFFLALAVLGIYVLLSAVTTVWRTRKTASSFRSEKDSGGTELLTRVRKQSARVDRSTTMAFYIFGFVLFSGLVDAYTTIDNSRASGEWLVLRNFVPHFAFAGNVFFALLVLHVVGWFLAYRVDRFSSRGMR